MPRTDWIFAVLDALGRERTLATDAGDRPVGPQRFNQSLQRLPALESASGETAT